MCLTDATSTPAPAATVYVQLGAFSSAASAKKSWTRLQRSFAELQSRKPTIDESPVRGSKLYRLRVGLASLEEASLVCAALTRGGVECLLPESR
ncbi:MAG: SPOR domain-containing protein [Gammaproteobacteria bacterium]|nr:SPOR domain-containing protein [Gammaproteobacteria bacterium]